MYTVHVHVHAHVQYRSNVCTVWYAPGALEVCWRYALGTLMVRSSLAVQCISVWSVRYGPPIIGYVRICDHVRA